jgi:hypothetical protein
VGRPASSAGLARPGHAHDDAVGREIGGVEQHGPAVQLAGRRLDPLAQIEMAGGDVDHAVGRA